MNTIVLTGACSGLGGAIHNLLISERYSADQRIFLCRSVNYKKSGLIEYLSYDFSRDEFDASSLNINPSSKKIIFINNAGSIGVIDKAINLKSEQINESVLINFLAPLKLSQILAMAALKNNAELVVLNITTGATVKPVGGWLSYNASKAAIKIAFDTMAVENSNVRIIHYDPGVIDTNMQAIIRSSSADKMPSVALFNEYKVNQMLRAPEVVAQEIDKIILEL